MNKISTQHGKHRNKSKNTVTKSRLMDTSGDIMYSKAERKQQAKSAGKK